MRVYSTFTEAKNEIARDLNELGTRVFAGYQSMEVDESKRDDLTTTELRDYDYIVVKPQLSDLDPTQPWADAEWQERLQGLDHVKAHNPGKAWELRREVWEPLLDPARVIKGRRGFSYTYSERFYEHPIDHLIDDMIRHPTTRQCWISVWDPILDTRAVGKHRVPCTLGYQLMQRDGKLDIAYHMRSSDFATHFDNDIYLAVKLQEWFAQQIGVKTGRFTHKIGSLHVYASEVSHVF